MLRSLVGSEMCIRDRYQRRVRGALEVMAFRAALLASHLCASRISALHTTPACAASAISVGHSHGSLQVEQFGALGDNYGYLVHDPATKSTASIAVSYTHLTLPTKRIV
eukprot:TRINITY_DN18474_c0_g1_i2.p2 TRINITY_DN18474_c0_g1~~TRINITY_DN18474_c0_g1_i2.p2  ORF type:complete len:109 (+),score=29.25 TRINITY_DN18474_c0_g1_i2:94-420(+)